MTEEIRVIECKPEMDRGESEQIGGSLAGNPGTLEQGVKDAWHGATAAATRTAERVKSAATTTMQAMQGAAQSTGEAMGRAFDLPAHVRRYPWLMVSGAMLLGMTAGYLVGRQRR